MIVYKVVESTLYYQLRYSDNDAVFYKYVFHYLMSIELFLSVQTTNIEFNSAYFFSFSSLSTLLFKSTTQMGKGQLCDLLISPITAIS